MTQRGSRPVLDGAHSFLGVPIHLLSMAETAATAMHAMRERVPLQHVCLNVAKFVRLRQDADLRNDVFGADLISIDGMGIVIGARIMGLRVPERVTGVDLMEHLLARCAAEGFRPYFLGATRDVLNRAMCQVRLRHPKLEIAGSQDGYFNADEEAEAVARIQAAKPDCLFVGMPTPRKERFMAKYRAVLDVPFVMGVGGGIDILAGHVRRAPSAWQRLGMEWLYRVVQEPKRMWRRYLVSNMAYAVILARAVSGRALGWRPAA
jgi:N-acetylglucosaminyldiphosphoundecaprenol N-acetyl-beta-D-mannosaminyltransferase